MTKRGNPNWAKGVSGNPSGRPKADKTIQELARAHCPKAIDTLAAIMGNAKATEGARVHAASAILDRGYGKPPQFNTGDAAQFRKACDMTDDELASIAAGGSNGAAPPEIDPSVIH